MSEHRMGEPPRYEALYHHRVRERLSSLRGNDPADRDQLFAIMELAERMSADPVIGQPIAGSLGATLDPLDSLWWVEFDISTWPAAPRYLLYYLPPNLEHPSQVIWLGIETAR